MAIPEALSLPFDQAIKHFRQKVAIPTARWHDLWEGMHARAWTVAGALKEELLADLRKAVDKAIADGGTLAEFRKDFDAIVAKHGWKHKGGRDWRSRLIFDVNLRTAHAAGRWEQIQAVKARRPYLRYVAILDSRTRPEHRDWHDTVLEVDDKWWKVHYPPNGWNCRCTVQSISLRDLGRYGLKLTKTPPADELETVIDPRTDKAIKKPKGIDLGWQYNVGEAATGSRLADDVMEGWRRRGGQAFERLTPGDWRSWGRPAAIPREPAPAPPGPPLGSVGEIAAALRELLGGDAKALLTPIGRVTVNATALAAHVDPARSPLLPMLPGVLADPFEIWLAFERHKGTGQVVLRQRFVRSVDAGEGEEILVVAQAARGRLEAWTILQTRDADYIERQRVGRLLFGREGVGAPPTSPGAPLPGG